MSEPEPRSSESPSPELKGFEASLAALMPATSTVDRDRLMYEAGRASRRSPHALWATALVGCALIALVYGQWSAGYYHRAALNDGPTIVAEETTIITPTTDPDSYLQLRRLLADADLAAFDAANPRNAADDLKDRNSLLRELLN